MKQWWLISGAALPKEPLALHLVEAVDLEEALRNYYAFGWLVRFMEPPAQPAPAELAAGPFDIPKKALGLEPWWAKQRILNLLASRSSRGNQTEERISGPVIAANRAAVGQNLGY